MEGSTLRGEQDSRKLDKCGAVIKFLLQWYPTEKAQPNHFQKRSVTDLTQRGVGGDEALKTFPPGRVR